MSDASTVTTVALWMAAFCFLLYVAATIVALFWHPAAKIEPAVAKAADAIQRATVPSVSDMTKLIEALTKFSDSLTKASPALVSLIGAILFLSIAAYSGSVTATKSQANDHTSQSVTKDQQGK